MESALGVRRRVLILWCVAGGLWKHRDIASVLGLKGYANLRSMYFNKMVEEGLLLRGSLRQTGLGLSEAGLKFLSHFAIHVSGGRPVGVYEVVWREGEEDL